MVALEMPGTPRNEDTWSAPTDLVEKSFAPTAFLLFLIEEEEGEENEEEEEAEGEERKEER